MISISGGAIDVDVLGDHRLGVVLGERVAQRLVAGDLGAETGLEEPAGRLAGTEARHLDLVGQLAERGVDRPLEIGGGDRDVEADLVALERFD